MSTSGTVHRRDHSRLRRIVLAVGCSIAVLAALMSPTPAASAQQAEDFDGLLAVRNTPIGQRGMNHNGSPVGLTTARNVGFDEVAGVDFALTTTGDFNNDGFDELAVAERRDRGYLRVYVGNPNGIGNLFDGYGAPDIERVVAGDFNGDLYDDLAMVRSAGAGQSITTYSGGHFYLDPDEGAEEVNGSPITTLAWSIEAAVTGDFDGDGDDDLLVTRSTPDGRDRAVVFNGTRTGLSAIPVVVADTVYQIEAVAASDFNGDGFDDVVFARSKPNGEDRVLRYRGSAAGLKWASIVVDTNDQIEGITAGDFDGDGFGDLAILRFNQYGQQVLIHSGDSRYGLTGHSNIAFRSTLDIHYITGFESHVSQTPTDVILGQQLERWKARNPGIVSPGIPAECHVDPGCVAEWYTIKVMS